MSGKVLLFDISALESVAEANAAINQALDANPGFAFWGFGQGLPATCFVLHQDPPTTTQTVAEAALAAVAIAESPA